MCAVEAARLRSERRREPEGGRKRWRLREREKGKLCCLVGFLLCSLMRHLTESVEVSLFWCCVCV